MRKISSPFFYESHTIRSCALRSVTILGYVRAAIAYSPLAFGEAENKLYPILTIY